MSGGDAKERARSQAINDFLSKAIQVSRNFEEMVTIAAGLTKFWEDNDYANEITIEDLEPYRFNKDELIAFVSLLYQVLLMASNQQITPKDYQEVNNRIK